ncbi:MAG TPA: hydantoinase/oxoprolinase family protein [Microvirga sp.]|jgi:N-methylhydantoinase A|nr:hydantoinase/oxoprolinase family protein [Microvirga sp.]
MKARPVRVGADIGGTFTDIALEVDDGLWTVKVPTTHAAPERAVMEGLDVALEKAGRRLDEIGFFVHGTTLATNALIERKGARTALLTTDGFRDILEMGNEGRFDQYDIRAFKPEPLVPREWRFTVRERVRADGGVETPLDEAGVRAVGAELVRRGVESVAVGFLHAYRNGAHERRAGEILRDAAPGLSISLGHEVSPQIREYERLSTVCANAYIQPVVGRYLANLERRLAERGLAVPLMLILSSGSLSTVETAARFPIRLLESGPAGGAIFASTIAREIDRREVLSFDLGGTTAKFCLVDDGRALTALGFEVGRTYRFKRGSGLPVRIPVVDLVEIGAGGGSIARLDPIGRITAGPDSAGSEPGPACYGRGGDAPTVTDCDLVLGKLDAATFAGGTMPLDAAAAERALERALAAPAGLSREAAAFAVTEIVAETMASAARVHATERGAEIAGRTMVAFGGAAPLHAARFAERLGIRRIVVPVAAGVGSAVGFLRAPVAYEIARSVGVVLNSATAPLVVSVARDAETEARRVVERAADPSTPLQVRRTAHMRYRGQGHEIEVPVPESLDRLDADGLSASYALAYERIYGRTIPNAPVEVTVVSVTVSAPAFALATSSDDPPIVPARSAGTRRVFDAKRRAFTSWDFYERASLAPGAGAAGPAIIAEADTTTVVPSDFRFRVDARNNLVLEREENGRAEP